jgi:hypothetical protein
VTGEELYRLWLGDPEGKTDAARYFTMMNPAQREDWERLAGRWSDLSARAKFYSDQSKRYDGALRRIAEFTGDADGAAPIAREALRA